MANKKKILIRKTVRFYPDTFEQIRVLTQTCVADFIRQAVEEKIRRETRIKGTIDEKKKVSSV